MNSAFGVAALSIAMLLPGIASAQNWPAIKLPEGLFTIPVGEQITQNGLPMRLQVFFTKQSSTELAMWFRESFGRRHVENQLGDGTVIGRADGDYYLSVKLTPAGNGTRGIVAVSRIRALADAAARGEQTRIEAPGGSRMLSDTTSEDGGKATRHLIYTNRYSQDTNRELVSAFLKDKGYKLERDAKPDEKPGQALFFRDGDREAVAVITRQGDEAAVVVNMTSRIKTLER